MLITKIHELIRLKQYFIHSLKGGKVSQALKKETPTLILMTLILWLEETSQLYDFEIGKKLTSFYTLIPI